MIVNLKSGEHLRIQTDGSAPVMVYVEQGLVHVNAQPKFQPTRVVVMDRHAKLELPADD
jgi:redox-sensitive bicupin YhaK (pirin superfamily)